MSRVVGVDVGGTFAFEGRLLVVGFAGGRGRGRRTGPRGRGGLDGVRG